MTICWQPCGTALLQGITSQHMEHRNEFLARSRRLQFRPLRLRNIAEHQEGDVVGWIRRGVPEAAVDRFYVLPLAGEKEPAGSGTEFVGIFLHHGRGIARRVGGDRDQPDIVAETITQEILYLRERMVDDRAGVLAVRVEKVDQDDLVLEDVRKEATLLSILRNHRKVGEVAEGLRFPQGSRLHFRRHRGACRRGAMMMFLGDRRERRERGEKHRNQRYSRHAHFLWLTLADL